MRTPAELVSELLVAADLGGEWAQSPDLPPTVLTAEDQEQMPFEGLCPQDGDERALTNLGGIEWQVASGFTFGEPPEFGFVPFVLQAMLSTDAEAAIAAFEVVENGVESCVGTESFMEDAGDFRFEAMTLPEVGDERVGVHWVQLDQSEGMDRWDMRFALVRDGGTLIMVSTTEIRPTAEAAVSDDVFGVIVEMAVAHQA